MFENVIKHYPDFPVKGIDFIDVMPFLQNPEVFRQLMHEIDSLATSPTVATVEARGFLFAAPLLTVSSHITNLLPIRKKGKLPFTEGDLRSVEIEKEYGTDEVFYRLSDLAAGKAENGVMNVTFFDDVLATGGTASGIAKSLEDERVKVGGVECRVNISEFVFLIELTDLAGAAQLSKIAPVQSIVKL